MFVWLRSRLWLYDQFGTVMSNRMIALARYAREEIGVQHVVIDSLMKCGIATDDYGGQKSFVDKLSTLAKDTNVHIHLVAHARKGENEDKPPGKMDISGTADLTNMADNVVTCWVNKKKVHAVEQGKHDYDDKPDAVLSVEKQRNGDYEGRCWLWFHGQSLQFHAREGGHAIDYLSEYSRED
jgi:twinkle protein